MWVGSCLKSVLIDGQEAKFNASCNAFQRCYRHHEKRTIATAARSFICHQYHVERVLMLRPSIWWEEGILWSCLRTGSGTFLPLLSAPVQSSQLDCELPLLPFAPQLSRPFLLSTPTKLLFKTRNIGQHSSSLSTASAHSLS